MEKNTICKVYNRTGSSVSYKIPETNNIRRFEPGEPKEISFEELEKLSYTIGGKNLLKNYLRIEDKNVLYELGLKTEPEYHMTDAEIRNLMLKGSLDSFLDCLDFAPVGVIDTIKKFAVELPLKDLEKCEALKKATGFDVVKVLDNIKEETEEKAEVKRRVSVQEDDTPKRRVPKYDIVG